MPQGLIQRWSARDRCRCRSRFADPKELSGEALGAGAEAVLLDNMTPEACYGMRGDRPRHSRGVRD